MPGSPDTRVYWAHRLHATVLNSIGAAILQSQVCERAVRSALPTSAEELARLRQMLILLEGETRALAASAARPRAGSLRDEVTAAVERAGRAGPPVRVRIEGPVETVPRRVARGAAVVLAEALANAVQHGRPSSIDVDVAVLEAGLLVRVRDDGAGCDVMRLEEHAASGRRCGLAIMRAQSTALAGRLEVSSASGRGTQVSLFVPVRTARGAAGVAGREHRIP